jgi:hypothetical protein
MAKNGFSAYERVYTRASTAASSRRFFPVGPSRDASDIASVRWQLDIYNLTGDTFFEVGYQVADNEESWPTGDVFTPIGTYNTTSEGPWAGTGFDSIVNGLTKARVQFGVIVRNNTSGARIELAMVSGRFDTRSC